MDHSSTPVVITCKSLPSCFRYEVGMHRVQRIPPTERRGRVHTSTVSVVILEEAPPSRSLRDDEIRYRWHSGTGAGGQHRNKTQNCLELTHLPTGISVSSSGRSRKDNEKEAMDLLQKQIERHSSCQRSAKQQSLRREQAGSGSRSGERIRTWRFQMDKIVDHQTGRQATIKQVARKGLNVLWPE